MVHRTVDDDALCENAPHLRPAPHLRGRAGGQSCGASLRRRPQFAQEPRKRIGPHRVGGCHHLFNVIAFDALNCAQVKNQASRLDTGEHHWALAFRTLFALKCDQRDCGCGVRIGHCMPRSVAESGDDAISVALKVPQLLINIAHV